MSQFWHKAKYVLKGIDRVCTKEYSEIHTLFNNTQQKYCPAPLLR